MIKSSAQELRIGILGGGQLGRMLLQSAIDFNLHVSVLDPDPDAPCKPLVDRFVQGSFRDHDTVMAFGANCDLITIEIEDVAVSALFELEAQGKLIYPQPRVIALIQDKREQKRWYQDKGFPTAPFVLTDYAKDVLNHAAMLPAFHKLGKGGYDGKGVVAIRQVEDWQQGFDTPALLEKAATINKEFAIIVARNTKGEVVAHPEVEMVFDPVHNLVSHLVSPSTLPSGVVEQAQAMAHNIVDELGIIGLLAIEFFYTQDGEIWVNEMAPRPHNSGHHTMRACPTSQFEQHWRAILGLPLGDTRLYMPAAMVNILGEPDYFGAAKYQGMDTILAQPLIFPHLYGKAITKPARKMGHVTIMAADNQELAKQITFVQQTLKVVA